MQLRKNRTARADAHFSAVNFPTEIFEIINAGFHRCFQAGEAGGPGTVRGGRPPRGQGRLREGALASADEGGSRERKGDGSGGEQGPKTQEDALPRTFQQRSCVPWDAFPERGGHGSSAVSKDGVGG